MRLTERHIEHLAIGQVFNLQQEGGAQINAFDFSPEGDYLVTSSDDESIRVYNCISAMEERKIWCKKYGVNLIRFTHSPNAVICASKNDWDDSIRYLSLHDNKYLRYFKGHRDRVIGIATSPCDDTFISASLDKTIRLWDLRSASCQGLFRREERPAVGFDPKGLVFAVASANKIRLFDHRSFDKGPFSIFPVGNDGAEATSIKFSNNGRLILYLTNQKNLHLLDAYHGYLKGVLTDQGGSNIVSASFTPDSQFILAGTQNGRILIWRVEDGNFVKELSSHGGAVSSLEWNPKYMMMASACSNLLFWVPNPTSSPFPSNSGYPNNSNSPYSSQPPLSSSSSISYNEFNHSH